MNSLLKQFLIWEKMGKNNIDYCKNIIFTIVFIYLNAWEKHQAHPVQIETNGWVHYNYVMGQLCDLLQCSLFSVFKLSRNNIDSFFHGRKFMHNN